jgi:hypothetical protein
VVLAHGVPDEVVPEERFDAVVMGGALALEKTDLSVDRWSWIWWDDARVGTRYACVPVQKSERVEHI